MLLLRRQTSRVTFGRYAKRSAMRKVIIVFIATVPKHGYRFIAPVKQLPPEAVGVIVQLKKLNP